MEDLERIILKHALLNAIRHNGKANSKAVMGKIMAERKDLRRIAKEIAKKVEEIVKEINTMSLEQQRELLMREFKEEFKALEKKAKRATREELPPLPNVEEALKKYGVITTRFAPAPTGALHIGQVLRAAMLSYLYAKKYNGRMILRIEDTDPRIVKRVYYDWILEDLSRLGIKWDKLVIMSDRFEKHYEVAEKLIRDGNAYVCTCTAEEFRRYKEAKIPCPDRNLPITEHIRRWEKMLEGYYSEGEAVVRLKTDMTDPNPVLRDPPLLRIVDSVPHPRTGYKYHIYPLYNFGCAVEDHMEKVTHVIRAKEHEHNAAVQSKVYEALKWDMPIMIQYGMVYIEGFKIHKRHIREGLKKGEISGWDDVKLPTIKALLRRGIQPEAIRRLAIEISLTPHDIKLSMETLYAINRQIIDPIANRYFFVKDPIELIVDRAPSPLTVKIRLHPLHPERGFKIYKLKGSPLKILISKEDLSLIAEGKEIRLIGLFNVKIKNLNSDKIVSEYTGDEIKKGIPKIHWVIPSLSLWARVIKPDGSIDNGLIEYYAQNIKNGEIVQLERYGFVRLERNEGEVLNFIFLHD